MALDGLVRPSGWRLSRRLVALLLAGTSVLQSRLGSELLATVQDLTGAATTGFLVYRVSIGRPTLGLTVAWAFLGYFVYAYTPELFRTAFGEIADAHSFRVLTAVGALWIGFVVSRVLGTVPAAGPFALVPDGFGGQLTALVVGILALLLAFDAYLVVWRRERRTAADASQEAFLAWFTVDDQPDIRAQLGRLPGPARPVGILLAELFGGAVYLVPCLVLGLVLAVLSAFYPVPEVLLLVGLLASYTPVDRWLRAAWPAWLGVDLDRRVAADATDAVRNFKGLVLVVYCAMGIATCGLGFLVAVAVVEAGVGDLVALGGSLGSLVGLPPGTLAGVGVRLWFALALLLTFPLYSLYGLLYWAQQLRRLRAYVPFWEAHWGTDRVAPPRTTATRPPGLLVPGNALVLLVGAVLWVADGAVPSLAVMVAFALAWTAAAAVLAWSTRATRRHRPQSPVSDGRDVLLALLGQVCTVGLLGAAVAGTAPRTLWVLPLVALVLCGFAYFPEVSLLAERRDDAGFFLDVAYLTTVLGVVVFGVGRFVAVPPVVALAVGGVVAVWLLAKVFDYVTTRRDDAAA